MLTGITTLDPKGIIYMIQIGSSVSSGAIAAHRALGDSERSVLPNPGATSSVAQTPESLWGDNQEALFELPPRVLGVFYLAGAVLSIP
jgi:hypothetical protein